MKKFENNPMYQNIVNAKRVTTHNVRSFADYVKVHKRTVFEWLKGVAISEESQKKLIKAGFNPKTLKQVKKPRP